MNQDNSIIKQPIEQLAFIDIETVANYRTLMMAPPQYKDAWLVKCAHHYNDGVTDPRILYVERAALHPEFSKMCCISLGAITLIGDQVQKMRIKSYYGADEKALLFAVSEAIGSGYYRNMTLCGHNILNFDMPFLNKRYIINGLPIPKKFNFNGCKPWEVDAVDTYNVWKFTGMNSCGLEVLCMVLGIESPKKDISGANVHAMYYAGQFTEIGKYCAGDVKATAQVVAKMKGVAFDFPVEISE